MGEWASNVARESGREIAHREFDEWTEILRRGTRVNLECKRGLTPFVGRDRIIETMDMNVHTRPDRSILHLHASSSPHHSVLEVI